MADASSSSLSQSDAQIEETLDRMLTRLALADDSNLSSLLPKILPYSISSLSSPSQSIRKLVLEILSHVNKRVKHRPEIGLPFSEIWRVYSEPNAVSMVRNFCIVYIEMAFERLPKEVKEESAPELLVGLGKRPQQHQDIILRIVAKVIGECHSSRIAENIAGKYRTISNHNEGKLFLEFCYHTILYQPIDAKLLAGLSVVQSNRVTGKLPLKGDTLLTRKLGILNVVEAMQFPPERVYPLYLAAASDGQEAITRRGEELLKRKAAGVNLDDSDLIRGLFMLFNGTVGVENIVEESRVTPANPALRARLMSVFCHSIAAANSFPLTLQCIFGCIYGGGTTSRLKQMGMEFTVWVFKHAAIDQLKLMGPVILSAILKDLDGSSRETESTARDTKTFAFQAIGLLASRMPHLFREKTDMAVRLFAALKSEDQSLRLAIQEALNSLVMAYKEQSEVRFCAVRWASSLFDLQHCPSRYICMLGAADTKLDIREMALEGLYLLKNQGQKSGSNSDLKYPDLRNMLDYICHQQPKVLYSSEIMEKELIFSSKTYVAMVRFLMKCFEADSRLCSSEAGFSEYDSPLVNMCLLLEHAMAIEGSTELHATASKALVDIGFRFPKMIAARFAERISWLKVLLGHIDSDTRESASRLLGIACSAISNSAASSLVSDIASSVGGKQTLRFENHHGALCALGYVTAECMKETPIIPEALLFSIVNRLVDVIESESATLASVAIEAIGHIGLRYPLPALDRNSISAGVLPILRERLSKLLADNDTKAIQKIVISLGHISFKEKSVAHLNIALDLIFGLCRSKVEDVLFAAGEALSFIWGGVPVTPDLILKSNYSSLSQSSNYLTGEMPSAIMANNPSDSDNSDDSHCMAREVIIKKLFDDLLYSSRKEERCAGTVWLVSLTMYCGHQPKLQQLLPEIQEAFSHLLGEQNELTQELASQGMSIVYDLGDSSMKQNLVNALVGTLTGSGKRKRAIKLTEDSEVFQEGAIGENLGGGKLSTYKELCGLANEMGQPDLIYKFMDLANYQAALNSKRGAAFGFSKIAKQAGDALQPHLRSLIPRLIRYQYDPDKNVQDAMAHIWKSIVAEPKKTVDEYFDPIVEDLLIQSGSRLWRSREASCLALADIIQGRKFIQVSKHLRRIWSTTFRAMDDIKETVRNAGDSLCRAVTSLTTRLCDVSLTAASDATETMNIVLPFFLVEGIVSKVSSIQKASIAIVMKLSKGAGTAIRPHLPDLVCCMLECLSSLEDQRLNYVELHAANVGIQTEKLENLRIAVAKDSPMWETLDLCLKVVDAQSLDLLVPRLMQMVRSGVGLNTRVGVASFITFLVQKVTTDIKPYVNMLSNVLFRAVLDEKSGYAKRSFASSCAIILKYASPSQAQKIIENTAALHSGDRNSQISCAILLKNYSSLAADVVNGYHATILPIIFLSRFDDDKDINTLYEELWEDNSSTERVTLQLYLTEIVNLLSDSISSLSWASKRKSAKGIRKLSDVLGESLASVHRILLNCLLKEIPGRLWEGKDVILHSIASLTSSCHGAIASEDPATPNIILSAITSACTKKAKTYREAAFSCLEQVIRAFDNPDFFSTVFPMLHEVSSQACAAKPTNSSLVTSSGTGEESAEVVSVSLDKVVDCVTSCLRVARLLDVIEHKEKLIHVFLCALSPGFNWTVKMSVFSCIKELCSKLHPSSEPSDFSDDQISLVYELFHSVGPKVVECIQNVKISQVHTAASECLLEMSKLYRGIPSEQRKNIEFSDELIHLCEVEKSEQAKTLLQKVVALLEELGEENTPMVQE
ncbi:proteasome-associated protein ECM29 homolog isoform X2 [Asparagus officinalis]|uniref:proteasome-associated protein ECM29 homolog isoform X2 n=1 Tax=Asparagus officinalis TaxID=4686 RepID=UPI00098DF99C|nr:proteasome-associated protein ECM29 homolog isoform X2 [Asparagus officinalis]